MSKKYRVTLSPQERKQLLALTGKGEAKARQLTHARVLLLSDDNRQGGGMTDYQIADILSVSLCTIHRIRRKFVTEGVDAALEDKPRSGRPPLFSGRDAATITALACSTPPEGYARWSMRLIADKAVELEYVESISYVTVFNMLKKTRFHLT